MRVELLNELKDVVLSKIGVSFNQECQDTFFTPYEPSDEDETPEEIYSRDNVTVVVEWEYGDVYIEGLTEEEQKYLEKGEN
jgi:hypothetical protein